MKKYDISAIEIACNLASLRINYTGLSDDIIAELPLADCIAALDDYCAREYGHGADVGEIINDITSGGADVVPGVAYTTYYFDDSNGEIEIQCDYNFSLERYEYYADGVLVVLEYSDYSNTALELRGADFGDFIAPAVDAYINAIETGRGLNYYKINGPVILGGGTSE